MPGFLGDDPDRKPVARIRADVRVQNVDFALAQIRRDPVEERVEGAFVDRPVRLAPVDVALARRLFDEELVLRRAARVLPRVDDQLAIRAQFALAALQGSFVERCDGEVVPDGAEFAQAELVELAAQNVVVDFGRKG
jgi:hypothetical protein